MFRFRPSVLLFAVLSTACGSDADDDAANSCNSPTKELAVTNALPAPGASQLNRDIFHSFKLDGQATKRVLKPVFGPSHTAGEPIAPIYWGYAESNGAQYYQSNLVTWTTSPAHVELVFPDFKGDDGCPYALPNPVFSYDVHP